jgi:hypothetical protein
MKRLSVVLFAAGLAAALSLVACGGGGGTAGGNSTASSAGSISSGTITAFGSVFVNGHEFATGSAQVIDDDTGATSSGNAGLEVGMAVDVRAAANSSSSASVAAEIHVHPLARGIVDTSDSTGGTLTVMGQTVQITASTLFSDHRACLTATTSPCTAIAGQSGLTATTGTGSSAVPGNYVTVHGFLFSSGTPPGSANIVATLVSVGDAPATAVPVGYKAEGVVTAAASNSITIGGLAIDLSNATCRNASGVTPCTGAFSAGQTVSVFGATAPALPATSFTAGVARLRSKLVVETVGASVELEGKVSSVTTTAFVLRGITVDASALTGGLPAQGDFVRVLGTVADGGNSILASSLTILHAALSATYGLEGNVGAGDVAPGTATNTFVLTLLGQSIAVDASTRLDDRTVDDDSASAMANPFNITTFETYLATSSPRHVVVRAQADASGNLSALSVTITKASTVSGIAGLVDATPAPVNGATTPSTLSVHGLAVSADPAAIVKWANDRGTATATVAAGDLVLARGSFVPGSPGTLNVAAPTGTLMGAAANIVIDFGVPRGRDHDPF